MTHMNDNVILPWIYKDCGFCSRSCLHYLSETNIHVVCSKCEAEEVTYSYQFLALPQAVRVLNLNRLGRGKDDEVRCRLANRLGDQLLEDLVPETKLKNVGSYFVEFMLAQTLRHPWFASCTHPQYVYKVKNRFLSEDMFPLLWDVPESIERRIERDNRLSMNLEDRRGGGLRFVEDPEYNYEVSMLSVCSLNDEDDTLDYFWNGARVFLDGKWHFLTPNPIPAIHMGRRKRNSVG